ncbi:MAG: hypothetical protein K2Z80_01665 [Xanthobacteraceae bacterium]|nr:hypothetical protein [Xanthobacteraceae bacterium]
MPLRWAVSPANVWRATSGAMSRVAVSGVAICLVQLSWLQLSLAHAAEFTPAVSEEGQTILLLDGKIEPGDTTRLALLVTALDNRNRTVSALYLNSRAGEHDAAIHMTEVVKRFKLSTIVADDAECASACFTVFAAGHKKFAGHRAQIGVHRSPMMGQESSFSYAATFRTARTVGEFGVPPVVVGKLVLTPPDQMAWLSPDELRSMNVTIAGSLRRPLPVAPPLPAATPAVKPDGISWSQYVAAAAELSRRRLPDTLGDACNLYTMLCSRSFKFIDKDELRVEVTTVEKLNGNVVRREVCTFGRDSPVRSCFDWDTLETSHAVQGNDGQWKSVIGKRH